MLLVHASVKTSPLHGLGLFANQFIPKDSPVWAFHAGFDLELTQAEIDSLPEPARIQLDRYGYIVNDGIHILCGDDARFMNHSDHANLVCPPDEDVSYALRDILPGEEITCNYGEFDRKEHSFVKKLAVNSVRGA